MSSLEIILLSLVQGLTEFLPISSSAHLILVPKIFGFSDQGLAFDVAVHFGTLTAVVLYFKNELMQMISSWFRQLCGKGADQHSRLMWAVLWGTVPVGLCGLFGKDYIELYLRSPAVIAWATLVFAIVLAFAARFAKAHRQLDSMTYKDILIIGCMQALALIPGTSRSGITITGGFLVGFGEVCAARYSFLLSIPVIILAAMLECVDIIQGKALLPVSDLLLAATISAVSAYLCIHYFLKLLAKLGIMPFVIYRLILAAGLFYFF